MIENLHNYDRRGSDLKKQMSYRDSRQFYISDNQRNHDMFKYKDNTISTSKYNIVTFLPKALFFQLYRLANVYFIIIAIIQSIPDLTPLSSVTGVIPIIIVLLASILREGWEDLKRHRFDSKLNNQKVKVYRTKDLKTHEKSSSLRLGEIIVIEENQEIPADIIILDSNNKNGKCFVETATLDGEKAAKTKICQSETYGKFRTEQNNFPIFTDVEGKAVTMIPNKNLYSFDGTIQFANLKKNNNHLQNTLKEKNNLFLSKGEILEIPVDYNQLLLRGSVLVNTKWIIGIVAYTGHDTKLLLNTQKSRVKFSSLENLLSKSLILILIFQSFCCIICSIMYYPFYLWNVDSNPYLPKNKFKYPINSVLNYFTYLVLFNTMIPISLIITLEIIKIVQGYFISVDCKGFSEAKQQFIKPGSVSLNEELGIINFIFSDKTGTLTQNKMEFKFAIISDKCYSINEVADSQILKKSNIEYEAFHNNYINYSEDSNKIVEYWKAISLTHECIATENISKAEDKKEDNYYPESNNLLKENNKILDSSFKKNNNKDSMFSGIINNLNDLKYEYSGISPDDIELVKTASKQKFVYLPTDDDNIRKVKIMNSIKEFEVIKVLEFSSDRKRMSIILKEGDEYKVYIKGADSQIKRRLKNDVKKEVSSKCFNYVDIFSCLGYRTLLIGVKTVTESQIVEFLNNFTKASLSLVNKAEAIERVCDQFENHFELLGATVVEDKLQDQVPETILEMRLAEIKLWMLTGDKLDTAYSISLSCNLTSVENDDILIFYGEKDQNFEYFEGKYNEVQQHNASLSKKKNFSIIIDSIAIASVFKNPEYKFKFFSIAIKAISVVCCRISPMQKSEIVREMKKFDKNSNTLAIGDGGNDVSMITEAHVGVGIYGEEGMRAVQASDYAIGEFKILRRLLFTHGRTNLIRISKTVLYFFYKNFLFTLSHFFFAFVNNCTGQTIIDDWFILLYNLIFTSVPIGVFACSDWDIRESDGKLVNKLLPFLFKERRDNPIFSIKNFLLNMMRGAIQGLILFLGVFFALKNTAVDSDGNTADLWYFSVTYYTNMILVVTTNLILMTKYNTILHFIAIFVITFLCYTVILIIIQNGIDFDSNATMNVAFNSGRFYMISLLLTCFCFIIDIAIYSGYLNFKSPLFAKLMYHRNQNDKVLNFDDPDKLNSPFKELVNKFALSQGKKEN